MSTVEWTKINPFNLILPKCDIKPIGDNFRGRTNCWAVVQAGNPNERNAS